MYHRLNAESLGDPRIQLLCQENAACSTPDTNHASNQHTTLLSQTLVFICLRTSNLTLGRDQRDNNNENNCCRDILGCL